jgi:sigma-B regulation protein RsbU (phosphoserine phosphatase)
MELALIHSNQQMQEDLRNAAEFQRAVLPDITSPSYMNIAVKYMPLTQVSGDIYDISSNREGELCVFLGDATGHGVAAALMTMMVQIGLDSVNHNQPADKIVDQLNNLLATHETGKFMTGIYFRISANGCIRAANAGHSPVIILPHGGTDCVQLKNGGLPLGILREGPVSYREEIWELNQGDKIFIYTDGVTEWKNEGDEEFGQDRLVRFLCEHRESDVDVILDRLIESIGEFSDGCKSEDDLTTLGFQYRG